MLRQVFSLVVRIEAVFLRIVNNKIRREIERRLFAVNFHFLLRQRCFEAVGHAFVVGAEYDRVSAVHLQPELVVMISNLGKLLADDGFDHLIC